MSISFTLAQTSNGNGKELITSQTFTGSGSSRIVESIADQETDKVVTLSGDVSHIKLVYIVSSQDLTFDTYDGVTKKDTLSLLAGVPYVWHTGMYASNLLTEDFTSVKVTNASGATAALEVELLVDATP